MCSLNIMLEHAIHTWPGHVIFLELPAFVLCHKRLKFVKSGIYYCLIIDNIFPSRAFLVKR